MFDHKDDENLALDANRILEMWTACQTWVFEWLHSFKEGQIPNKRDEHSIFCSTSENNLTTWVSVIWQKTIHEMFEETGNCYGL